MPRVRIQQGSPSHQGFPRTREHLYLVIVKCVSSRLEEIANAVGALKEALGLGGADVMPGALCDGAVGEVALVSAEPVEPLDPAAPDSRLCGSWPRVERTFQALRNAAMSVVDVVQSNLGLVNISKPAQTVMDEMRSHRGSQNRGSRRALAARLNVDRKIVTRASRLAGITSVMLWAGWARKTLMDLSRDVAARGGRSLLLLRPLRADETPMKVSVADDQDTADHYALLTR